MNIRIYERAMYKFIDTFDIYIYIYIKKKKTINFSFTYVLLTKYKFYTSYLKKYVTKRFFNKDVQHLLFSRYMSQC